MATATFELALPAGYTQSGGKLLPSGLSYDGTDYSGADGDYDVYNIDGTGQWTYEAVTIGATQEPTGESATTTFTLSAPAGHATTTLATGFDPYIFQGWDTQPSVGEQLVYATADNTSITSNADMETDAAGEVDIYHVSATGVWTYAPINYANLPVADAPAIVPDGTITIGNITTTEDSASVPFTYDLTDATSYEHSTDGTTWTTVTSPVTRSGLTAETAYSGQIRPVNAEGAGTAVTYNFTTDAAAPPAPRPVFHVTGGTVYMTVGDTYSEPGISATDATDGDITASIQTTSNVNGSEAGSYKVIYTVTNSAGLTSSYTRNVIVSAAGDNWPFSKGIRRAIPVTWEHGSRHPKTGMRVRIFK